MSKKKSKNKDLFQKAKKSKGRIKVLRALPYRGSMIYLRVIDGEIFEWLITFKKEIYTGYLVITPRKGQKKLTEIEINQSAALALQGALTTVDTLMGDKLSRKDKKVVQAFEDTRKLMN